MDNDKRRLQWDSSVVVLPLIVIQVGAEMSTKSSMVQVIEKSSHDYHCLLMSFKSVPPDCWVTRYLHRWHLQLIMKDFHEMNIQMKEKNKVSKRQKFYLRPTHQFIRPIARSCFIRELLFIRDFLYKFTGTHATSQ